MRLAFATDGVMRRVAWAILSLTAWDSSADRAAAAAGDRALAIALANDATQKAAVASIVASGKRKIPLLLAWTLRPPRGVPECGLFGGLADAFGELRVREAIPFLVKHLGTLRSCGVSLAPWLKVPEVVEWSLPAVGALIEIGPDGSMAAMSAFPGMVSEEDRMAAIFVVSRVKGVPGARHFLSSVAEKADREHYWASQGILRLDSSGPGASGK